MKILVLIVGSTMGRLIRRRRSIGMFILTASLAPMVLLPGLNRSAEDVAELYNSLTIGLGMSILYPVTALVVSTAALGEERKAHTIPFLLLKPVSKWVTALGVVIAAAIVSFTILEAGVLVTWLVAAVMSGEWSIGVPTTVAVALQSLASAALFVPLGLVLNRATLAGLGYLFIWEGIFSSIIEGIQASSIYRIVLSAWADLAAMTPDTYDMARFDPGPGGDRAGRRSGQGGRHGTGLGRHHRTGLTTPRPGRRVERRKRHRPPALPNPYWFVPGSGPAETPQGPGSSLPRDQEGGYRPTAADSSVCQNTAAMASIWAIRSSAAAGSADFLASPAALIAFQNMPWSSGKRSRWCGLKKSVQSTDR